MKTIDYSGLPNHMQEGMRRYIEQGVRPGDFLSAVLSNDLMQALGKADTINSRLLWEYGNFLYNEAPAWSFGSTERFENWIKMGGLAGGAT